MQDPKLLFVLGYTKSGTTWLQILLNQHPNIMCANEAMFHSFGMGMAQAISQYNKRLEIKVPIFGAKTFPTFGKEEFQILFRNFVVERLRRQAANEAPDKKLMYLGEKDPIHVQQANVMMECFPDARFIHIIRDGRDVAVSWWHHMLRYDGERVRRNNRQFSDVVREQALAWSTEIRRARAEAARTGAHYHEVRYEGLLDDPHQEFTAMLEFLDVPRSKEIIEKCIEDASFSKLSGGRQSGEEDKSSFYRKGVKGDWQNHMDDGLSDMFVRAANGVMQELGYC